MKTKALLYALVLLLAFVLACDKQIPNEPSQKQETIIGIDKASWKKSLPYYDEQGFLRVPTKFEYSGTVIIKGTKLTSPRNERGVIYLAPGDWGKVKFENVGLEKVTSCRFTSCTFELEESVYVGPGSHGAMAWESNWCTDDYTMKIRGHAKVYADEPPFYTNFYLFAIFAAYAETGCGGAEDISKFSPTFSTQNSGWYNTGFSDYQTVNLYENACGNYSAWHAVYVYNTGSTAALNVEEWKFEIAL